MTDGLTLSGDLSEVNLPTILMSLYRERETGRLTINDGPYVKALHIRDGNVVFASSSDPDERLGECLLRRGVISVSQYIESAQQIRPGRRQGEILVDMGAISPEELVEGVIQQIYDIIFSLMPCSFGSYSLELADFSTEDMITLNVSMPVLLCRGMERVTRWSRIYPIVGEPETRVRRASLMPAFYHELELSSDQEHVLGICQEGISISSLLDASYMNSFETYRLLWIAITLGLIERVPEKPSGAAVPESLEGLIDKYNDMYSYLYQALGAKAADAAGEAMATVRAAYPGLASNQEGLVQYGLLDVDRLLDSLRSNAGDGEGALRQFLDEVLYALAFAAQKRLEPSRLDAFHAYVKSCRGPA